MQIIKVPGINGLRKTEGCERAGNAVIAALDEIHSNEQGKPIDKRLLDLEEIHLDNSDLELSNKLIYEYAKKTVENQNKSIFLGGDHSISFSLVKGFSESVKEGGKEPCLIIFDAHADCMPSMKEPTHEEWLRKVIDDGIVKSENVLLVGIRNLWKSEIEFVNEKGIRRVTVENLRNDIEAVTDGIMEFSNGKESYLSIDIDVLDPGFAPATGYKEPGGLTTRELLYILQRLNKLSNLRALDIVEINEELDKEKYDGATVKLGAKILSEFL
jgi:arginase family enzyme